MSRASLQLNAECPCLNLDPESTRAAIAARAGSGAALTAAALARRPHLLAETAVFISEDDWSELARAVETLEHLFATPPLVGSLTQRPVAAPGSPPPPGTGLLRAYDFHLTDAGPRLIEANTNAGGAFIGQALTEALTAGEINLKHHCGALRAPVEPKRARQALLDSFQTEYRLLRGPERSASQSLDIAIVDEAPEQEYLYPDMLLAASALNGQGHRARVTDRQQLVLHQASNQLGDAHSPLDLVYNRLTDFMLTAPASRPLAEALGQSPATVISPNPWHYRTYAHKSQLVALADPQRVDQRLQNTAGILNARALHANAAVDLWAERKALYFKPMNAFGSRAVYAGRKLTRNTFSMMQRGGFIAQTAAEPARRRHGTDEALWRFDLRVFAYRGEPIFVIARLYRGQATNFRTRGGGLAAVLLTDT